MIRVAIAGVGNCASSLLQAIEMAKRSQLPGLIRPVIDGFRVEDIEIVAAFDVDIRKVGQSLGDAAVAAPNCARRFVQDLSAYRIPVLMGPPLDGVSSDMQSLQADYGFRLAEFEPVDVAQILKDVNAEILLNYLPVGSEIASRHYAEACLMAGVGFINCIPAFIANDDKLAERFKQAKLPLIGDDVKSQLGASIIHRVLVELFEARGIVIDRMYQLNIGGNTDFANMMSKERLKSKRQSKTQTVTSRMKIQPDESQIHIGPSDFVRSLLDNKICHIRIDGRGLADLPVSLDLKLSVEDSPNSAAVVLDAIRYAKSALDREVGGVLVAPAAALMKSAPVQMSDHEANKACDRFLETLSHLQPRSSVRNG